MFKHFWTNEWTQHEGQKTIAKLVINNWIWADSVLWTYQCDNIFQKSLENKTQTGSFKAKRQWMDLQVSDCVICKKCLLTVMVAVINKRLGYGYNLEMVWAFCLHILDPEIVKFCKRFFFSFPGMQVNVSNSSSFSCSHNI